MKGKKPAFIAPTSMLIGDVEVEEHASIWYSAVLRGDNSKIRVGRYANVQDNCTIHAEPGNDVVIGDYTSIGHNAVLHGCKIGENTIVGMGCILLDKAMIGNNCLVGAGALVTANTVIPDNSLVLGSPGKVVRQLTEREIEANRENAMRYIRLAEKAKKLS